MTVAYPGAEGAFSHEACLRFLPGHDPVPVATFGEVVTAVQTGQTELGMLPLSNNSAGETGACELIRGARLRVLGEPVLSVRMHLLAMPSAAIGQIRTVVSHPVALRQCARALSALGVETEEAASTAVAAKSLSGRDRAVLGSERAAALYGLAIVKRDMHDRADNATRFAIVARGGE